MVLDRLAKLEKMAAAQTVVIGDIVVAVAVLLEKGGITDEELKAKRKECQPNSDKGSTEEGSVQPEDDRKDESDS